MKKINLLVCYLLLSSAFFSCETEGDVPVVSDKPTGLKAEVNTAKTLVTLSWQMVAHADSYELYVVLDDTLSYSGITASFVKLDDFTYNADYRWAVRTVSGDARGEWSESAPFRVNTNGVSKINPCPKTSLR